MKKILSLFVVLVLLSFAYAQLGSNLWSLDVGGTKQRANWSGGWFTWETVGADSVVSAAFTPTDYDGSASHGLLCFEMAVDTTAGAGALGSEGELIFYFEQLRAGQWWRSDSLEWSVYQALDAQGDSTVEVFAPTTQIGNLLIYVTDPTSSGTRELEKLPVAATRVWMYCSDSVYVKVYCTWRQY